MGKDEILRRCAALTVGLRHIVEQAEVLPAWSSEIGAEVETLHQELSAIEARLEPAIDDFMARRYLKFNAERARSAQSVSGQVPYELRPNWIHRQRNAADAAARCAVAQERETDRQKQQQREEEEQRRAHDRHAACFGPFEECGHTGCAHARKSERQESKLQEVSA